MKKNAFTLIELLVVIAVLGVLIAVILPNLIGVRARARDSARKNDLRQLKIAMRMYYNDHQLYPEDDGNGSILACGEAEGEAELCPNQDGSFAKGEVVYMKELPASDQFFYAQQANGEDFLLFTILESPSDTDIAASAAHCQVENPVPATYYLCADQLS